MRPFWPPTCSPWETLSSPALEGLQQEEGTPPSCFFFFLSRIQCRDNKTSAFIQKYLYELEQKLPLVGMFIVSGKEEQDNFPLF